MTQPVLTAHDADRITLVRALWQEVLEVDEVPEDTNFFDAGGDSLLLVALVERIRQAFGQPVRTMDVLRAGTVRGQAELLAGGDVVAR
ncbi:MULTISPECIES: acyl carrier protein [Streptacidiphilus]|uniref:Acyl carrier protein n=2 Tax=Streptacidiphilus TaxID=228398 RepID=A0ABV6UGX9_9ACTN|nr:acyl carrier protein [Streptacidiphilus jeojiense]